MYLPLYNHCPITKWRKVYTYFDLFVPASEKVFIDINFKQNIRLVLMLIKRCRFMFIFIVAQVIFIVFYAITVPEGKIKILLHLLFN